MTSLFRPEAVAHATGRLDGTVLLPAPLATWGAIIVAVAVLGLSAWFAATATYARHESVPGWLAPKGGVARVAAGRAGNDELIAELLVPPHVVGLVATGQTLPLAYNAPLFGRRLVQHGTVTDVSQTVVAPDMVGGPPVAGPTYRVRVRLPAQHVETDGARVQLRAGMSLNAQIAGHRRTLFESLFGRSGTS